MLANTCAIESCVIIQQQGVYVHTTPRRAYFATVDGDSMASCLLAEVLG